MTDLESLQQLIDQSRRIVFFGGAGVSTESGIPDFRSVDGLYRQQYDVPPETILSHTFYLRHPDEFFRFYRDKMLCLDAKPNAAHYKLAELEQAGRLLAVVTQNIDGLHQQAGSKRVFELHGSVHRNRCASCGRVYDASFVQKSAGIPLCACGGRIKPIQQADLLIVGGTSLAVYPAAGLADYYQGKHLVLINRSATPLDRRAGLLLRDSIGRVLGTLRV